MNDDIVIALATRNERETISQLLIALHNYAVVVVDDSEDGTFDILKQFPEVTARRGRNQGVAAAYLQALGLAVGFGPLFIVQMDAGFSHDPADIPSLLAASRKNGWGLTLGSRFMTTPLPTGYRAYISLLGALAARSLGVPVHDATCGFRVWKPNMLLRIFAHTHIFAHGNAFQLEMLYHAACLGSIGEVSIPYRLTNSHFGLWMLKDAAITYFRLLLEKRKC